MEKVNLFVVLLEGVLSFLSPCILPLLPVYLTILSSSDDETGSNQKKKLILNTILFILGISTTFFILGNSVSLFSQVLFKNKNLILILGGLLIILMGFFYTGIIQISFLQREKRFHYQNKKMNPITAYILGVTFSFGWTPCVGPMLTSVLVMASGMDNLLQGNLLILVYTTGFMLPFLLLAIFSSKLLTYLDHVKKHLGLIQKIGGIILVVTGAFMLFNGVKNMDSMAKVPSENTIVAQQENQEVTDEEGETVTPAPDFVLVDQYGVTHTLSDYKGKTVFLNFWATWCPPCREEMPHIEELYYEYGENQEDVIILGVTFPELGRETTTEGITQFLEDEGYTFPTVFDESQLLAYNYYINAFPTTFIINPEGNVEGYVPGAMNKEMMKEIIESTR